DYVKALGLPEGTYPLLAVAVGHSRAAKMERKGDREFEVIYR
ncbi:MAG TPA: nitroreductase, partial [Dialister sp.]|nr:nitroreductase [Dialister sp.]